MAKITRANQEFFSLYLKYMRLYGMKVYSKKDKWHTLWKILDKILKVLSRGKAPSMLTDFTTTLGTRVFFPVDWSIEHATFEDCVTLQHEAIHAQQYKQLGPLMWVLYLLVPLPIGLAYFRYKFERDAYLQSYSAARKYGNRPDIEHYVRVLSGPDYLWTWPKKSVRKWFKKHAR